MWGLKIILSSKHHSLNRLGTNTEARKDRDREVLVSVGLGV